MRRPFDPPMSRERFEGLAAAVQAHYGCGCVKTGGLFTTCAKHRDKCPLCAHGPSDHDVYGCMHGDGDHDACSCTLAYLDGQWMQ